VAAPPTSVFLIHGINQGAADMNALRATLTGPSGLDPNRYTVDAGFDFSDCTQRANCAATCTHSNGAQRLAQYIVNRNPLGDVVLVGYSLGGLIARDLIANNWSNVLGRYRIRMVTLGSPLLGYPNTSFDSLASCGVLLAEMSGNWRATTPPVPQLSGYLNDIVTRWRNGNFPGAGTWLAASGRFCATGVRGTTGCRDANLRNDGVVCDDSAAYNITTTAGTAPSRRWQDPSTIYAHTASVFGGLIFGCTASAANPVLSNPAPGPLLNEVLAAIQNTPPPPTATSVDVSEVLSMSFGEKQQFVRSAIHRGFPAESADALTMLLLNEPGAAVPVLEEFIAGEPDRGTLLVRKAAEWISFAPVEAASGAIQRLSSLDPQFAALADRVRDNARHVRKIQ
jgi:pimeloyl-ACP methyl ester carboxylesterase